MSAQIFLIGLDATSPDLITLMIRRGRAPNLRALAASCTEAVVTFPHGHTDDALWASFQYGLPLEAHGRYHWRRPPRAGGADLIGSDGEAPLEAFWERPARDGARIGIFDMPKARLTETPGGLHLTHWRAHGRYGDTTQSDPPAISIDVLARFGAYDHAPPEPLSASVATLHASICAKRDAAADYLRSQDWHLFATSFHELHTASHEFWPAEGQTLDDLPPGHPLFELLAATDLALGDIIAAAGPSARLCVFSTTGMAANRPIDHFGEGITAALNRKLGSMRDRVASLVNRHMPFQTVPYNENVLALRLAASVSPRRRISLLNDATHLVMRLRDAQTGAALFVHCDRPSANATAGLVGSLPDLLFLPAPFRTTPRRLIAPNGKTISARVRAQRSGNHSGNGVCWHSHTLDMTEGTGVLRMQDIGGVIVRQLALSRPQPRPSHSTS